MPQALAKSYYTIQSRFSFDAGMPRTVSIIYALFKRQIAEGGPVTVTDPNIIRYFMTIPEAAQWVIQAGAMGKGGDVFVLDMGEPLRLLN